MSTMLTTSIRRRLAWYGVLTVVMLVAIFAMAQQNAERLPNPAAEREMVELRTAVALASDVRGSLKNPKSFELVQVLVQSGKTVCMTYRATNAFNAVVPGKAVRQGPNYWVSDDGVDFRKRWEMHCARAGLNQTKMVARMIGG